MDRTKTLLILLLCSGCILQGCVLLAVGTGVAVGVGTVIYVKGELQTDYAAPLDQTWQASLDALQELDYRIISSQRDGAGGQIEARQIGGDKVKVGLSVSGPGTTLVKIRVGIFGDEAVSRVIEGKIASRLGLQ